MNKYPLIGGSICAVVLLVLASLTNVVGYQTVQASNQKIITTEIDEKELLFQTIVDMVNNKEIQKVILGSEMAGKRFFDTRVRFSVFSPPVLTEKFLKRIYTMGVILFRTLDKLKMQSVIEHHPVLRQGMQKESPAVVEKDTTLKGEMTQLSSLSCGCEDENAFTWHFPVICTFLFILFIILYILFSLGNPYSWYSHPWAFFMASIVLMIANQIHCYWHYPILR